MAMTPEEKINFSTQFNEMRSTLSAVMKNDKSENSRALWAIVWMLSIINQDLTGIFQELDFANQVQRTQSDVVNKQIENFREKMKESEKDAPKNFEEFQKNFEDAFKKAQEEARAQITPEEKAKMAQNLRDMADEIENDKSDLNKSDLKKRTEASNLHPIEKETEDGETETYTVEFPSDDQ